MQTKGFALVLVAIVLSFLAACQTETQEQKPVYVWQATYCEIEGCPSGKEVELQGKLFEGEEIGCKTAQTVFVAYPGYKFSVPVAQSYYLKPGTCTVFAYEKFYKTPVATPDRIVK